MSGDPTCKACRAPLRWAWTARGRRIPLDRDPDRAGNVILGVSDTGQPLAIVCPAGDPRLTDGREVFMPHHATCKHAGRFRRKERR